MSAAVNAALAKLWADMVESLVLERRHAPFDFANLKKAPKADGFDGWVKPVTAAGHVNAELVMARETAVSSFAAAKEGPTTGDPDRFLRSRPGEKHGPNATGAAGPCDPGCLKCVNERKSTDPLDVEYDGWTLRDLLEVDAGYRSDHHPHVTPRRDAFTPAQLGAISAHWSAELRAKVAASKAADKERDQRQVLVDLEDE